MAAKGAERWLNPHLPGSAVVSYISEGPITLKTISISIPVEIETRHAVCKLPVADHDRIAIIADARRISVALY
jgi:hypothetical protein